jgi:hypothetical protein
MNIFDPGQEATVPRGVVHTSHNANTKEVLHTEFGLSPVSGRTAPEGVSSTEEAFFRNTWGYRNDRATLKNSREISQVLAFNRPAGVVLMLPYCGAVSAVSGYLVSRVSTASTTSQTKDQGEQGKTG